MACGGSGNRANLLNLSMHLRSVPGQNNIGIYVIKEIK